MSNLLRKPHKGQSCLHQITPADAGWRYVGFGVHDLVSGQLLSDVGTDDEVCLVLLSGSAHFTAGDIDFGLITGRKSVFDRIPPHAVYLPHKTSWSVRAAASAEIAVCRPWHDKRSWPASNYT